MAPKGRPSSLPTIQPLISSTAKPLDAATTGTSPIDIFTYASSLPTDTSSRIPRITYRGIARPHIALDFDTPNLPPAPTYNMKITAFELFTLLLSLFLTIFLLFWLSLSLLNMSLHHIHSHQHRNPTYAWLSEVSTSVEDKYRRASRTLQNFSIGSRRQSRMSRVSKTTDEEEDVGASTRPPSYTTVDGNRAKSSVISLKLGQERLLDFGDEEEGIAKSTANIWKKNFGFDEFGGEEARRRSVYRDL